MEKCQICGMEFESRRKFKNHVRQKHSNRATGTKPEGRKKKKFSAGTLYIIAIAIAVIVISAYAFSNQRKLPPKTSAGHVEAVPPGRVLERPMSDLVHKHMLEHANGNGPPGIVINYNCIDYECPEGMLEMLKNVTLSATNIYLSPYPGMDAMVAATYEGRQIYFEEWDNSTLEKILDFIAPAVFQ